MILTRRSETRQGLSPDLPAEDRLTQSVSKAFDRLPDRDRCPCLPLPPLGPSDRVLCTFPTAPLTALVLSPLQRSALLGRGRPSTVLRLFPLFRFSLGIIASSYPPGGTLLAACRALLLGEVVHDHSS